MCYDLDRGLVMIVEVTTATYVAWPEPDMDFRTRARTTSIAWKQQQHSAHLEIGETNTSIAYKQQRHPTDIPYP